VGSFKEGVMKKLVLVLVLAFLATTVYAKENNLYEIFKKCSPIKVFLKEVANEAANPVVNTELFAAGFKDTLRERKELSFLPVDNEAEADVTILATIKDFGFTEEALPLVISPLLIAADVINPKSSARLVVDYEIVDPKDGKVLADYKNFLTYARRPREGMTEEIAYKYAIGENARRLILRTFYEPVKK
jgi:hypothetical protein